MNVRLLLFAMIISLSFSAYAAEESVPLHPDYPVVEGRYQMNQDWGVTLPGQFSQRFEGGKLVLWRPDYTMWFSVWSRENRETMEDDFKKVVSEVTSEAFDKLIERDADLIRLSYRLMERVDDRLAAFYCTTIGKSGRLQMRVYSDRREDISVAESVCRSLSESPQDK